MSQSGTLPRYWWRHIISMELQLRRKSTNNIWPEQYTFQKDVILVPFKLKQIGCAFLWYCLLQTVSTLESVSEIQKCGFQMKAIWAVLYCGAVSLLLHYKVVLTFESVDEILNCAHSNESYWAVLSCGAVYYAVEGASDRSNESSSFLWYCWFFNSAKV